MILGWKSKLRFNCEQKLDGKDRKIRLRELFWKVSGAVLYPAETCLILSYRIFPTPGKAPSMGHQHLSRRGNGGPDPMENLTGFLVNTSTDTLGKSQSCRASSQ